jgi:hypothetical protein
VILQKVSRVFSRCVVKAAAAFAPVLGALPRLAGLTSPRQRWFGARAPCWRVRLTRGFGTRAANPAMKYTGSKATWVVSYR